MEIKVTAPIEVVRTIESMNMTFNIDGTDVEFFATAQNGKFDRDSVYYKRYLPSYTFMNAHPKTSDVLDVVINKMEEAYNINYKPE